MPTPTSYLQTLAKDEAIAFVTSLQKVKDHVSGELQWMNQQVQQKTLQLQGVETLLAEATALGLAYPAQTVKPAAPPEASDSPPATPSSLSHASTDSNAPTDSDDLAIALRATQPFVGDSSTESTAIVSPPVTALNDPENAANETATLTHIDSSESSDAAAPGHRKERKSGSQLKTKRDGKSSSKMRSAKPKKAPTRASAEERPSAAMDDLRQLLQTGFQDKPLTDSVSQLLDRAAEPLSINDLIAQMYEGLSDENYKRAKNSIANVLAVGKSKGKWQNTGRGMYASNAIVPAPVE